MIDYAAVERRAWLHGMDQHELSFWISERVALVVVGLLVWNVLEVML